MLTYGGTKTWFFRSIKFDSHGIVVSEGPLVVGQKRTI
jgi:hypothetical protein